MSLADTTSSSVVAFNRDYPVGAVVRYWTGVRRGPGKLGTTRTEAQMLSGHTPVVWVTGEASCIALTHVQPEQCPHCTSPDRHRCFVMPVNHRLEEAAPCDHAWHDHDDTATDCGCVDCVLDAGWTQVAARMDRWATNGYAGDWQDAQYAPADEADAR